MPLFIMFGEYQGELRPELLDAHIAWLTTQFEAGAFVVSGATDAVGDRAPTALAIMEAESREAALAILDTEPFYLAGAITHDVVPYNVRVRTSGLDALLGGPQLMRVVERR